MAISRLKTILISNKDSTLPQKSNSLHHKAYSLPPNKSHFSQHFISDMLLKEKVIKEKQRYKMHPISLYIWSNLCVRNFALHCLQLQPYAMKTFAVKLLWDIFLCSVYILPTWARLASTYSTLLHSHIGVHILQDTWEYLHISVTT